MCFTQAAVEKRTFLFIRLETACKRQTDHPIFLRSVQEDTKIGQETYNPIFLQLMQKKGRADKRQQRPIFDRTDMQNKQITSDNIICLSMLLHQLKTEMDNNLTKFEFSNIGGNIASDSQGNLFSPGIMITICKEMHRKEIESKNMNTHIKISLKCSPF